MLKVATYNIHRCVGRDGITAPERIASVLGAVGADVTALQEVTYGAGGMGNHLDLLARAAGAVAIAGPTLLDRQGHYGNALLTRVAPLAVKRLDISVPGREPRGAMAVILPIHGKRTNVVVTHLGLHPSERRYQVRQLLSLIDGTNAAVTILLGDFNEWFPPSRMLRRMTRHFGPTPTPATFPSHFPLLALDRIWVYPAHQLNSLQTYNQAPASMASDHLPLVAEVTI
jgi:endonuclease/exonuclease/phosphatase family metal-dependent hydrolase